MSFTSYDDRKLIHNQLRRIGFGGFDDTNLIAQMAFCIEGHDHFRNVLTPINPLQRSIAYHALAPHLTFAPKPLDVYEAEMRQIAEQQQLPTWNDKTKMPEAYRVPEISLDGLATEAIAQRKHEDGGGVLTMICANCTVAGNFSAKRRKDAYAEAHNLGWRWAMRNGTEKCFCPRHVPGRLTMTLTCSNEDCPHGGNGKPKVEQVRAWDEQDGYTAARLRGWHIGDMARCPKCSLKELTFQ